MYADIGVLLRGARSLPAWLGLSLTPFVTYSRITIVAVVMLFSHGHAAAADKPPRVMSMNLCADQLVLSLLPAERITSVSYIARTSSDPELRARAARVAVNYGTAEEVLAQQPDLVLTGVFSTLATRAVLERAGYPTYRLPSAESFADIREQTLFVGRLVGAEDKARELVSQMDAVLAALARTKPEKPLSVVAWDGTGTVPGTARLFNDILRAAGGMNLAETLGETAWEAFGLEELLYLQPDLIVYAADDLGAPALRHAPLRHPVIRERYGNRQITYPETLYSCGHPKSAEAAKALRAAMAEARVRPEREP